MQDVDGPCSAVQTTLRLRRNPNTFRSERCWPQIGSIRTHQELIASLSFGCSTAPRPDRVLVSSPKGMQVPNFSTVRRKEAVVPVSGSSFREETLAGCSYDWNAKFHSFITLIVCHVGFMS